ncbi:hypothetical protein M0R45_035245 [Rubus argutus]|uniref:Late embryogenesis abundant protein LEA-2 subgroup domain-containing protein n=1 Tax=Rubus argutus TaxID=59490 RepID=A0AAW1VVG2_RUBAR
MAEKAHQAAPANGYTRSDGESLVSEDELKRQKRIKLFAYIGIFVVFQIIVITVFGLTVMKVKTPKVRLGDSTLTGFTYSAATPSFDTTFNTQIRVKNTNWGPYKFDAGIITFMYQVSTLGSELSGGVLTLTSEAKLTGKVELMLIMKKKKSASMSCTIQIDVSEKTVKSLQCK